MCSVYPLASLDSCESPSSSNAVTFTVWMKSLVMQGNGCTVYDENGQIVYRVDNYDKKGSDRVFLMDLDGNILFTILKRKFWLFKEWRGYKCEEMKAQNPFFKVRRICRTFRQNSCSEIRICDSQGCRYKLETSSDKKLAFRIVNCNNGQIIAEAKRKQSLRGELLGDDVLTLKVEGGIDHSLVMAVVVVNGLMNHTL